jgi:hypothetical protein
MKLDFMFDEEVVLFGLKRSGNAAIINFFHHLGDEQEYLHDHNTNLSITPKVRHWQRKNIGLYRKYLNTVEQMDLRNAPEKFVKYSKMKSEFSLKSKCDNFSEKQKNLILLRSPHNNLASLFESRLRARKQWIENFRFYWKQYARECLFITNYLGDSKIVVLFDEWFQSEDYRRRISSLLDMDYTERTEVGINYVIRMGSSFDGKEYYGRAQEMKVLDRWKVYKDNSSYREVLLGDEDMIEKTKEIFNIDLVEIL